MELKSPAFAAILIAVVAALFYGQRAFAQTSPDGQVIVQLKKAGSNLSKPHPIEFFFYFPAIESANRVARKLTALGYTAEAKKSAKGNEWLVLAMRNMIPTESDLVALRKQFNEIASSENGEYDGWETAIVK